MKDARSRSARGGAIVMFTAGVLQRHTAVCLVMLLAVPFGVAEAAPALPSAPAPQVDAGAPPQSQAPPANAQPPASPASAAPDQSAAQESTSSTSAPQSSAQNTTAAPQGTAAAPVERTVGVAASRPAGAAIAPAKQRRARSFLISIAVVVGAAVAIGTVVALSNASPSRP